MFYICFRLVAPTIFGRIFSWSLLNVKDVEGNEHPLGFPFNHYFSFFVMSVVGILCILILLFIKEDGNNKNLNEENHRISSVDDQARH